MRSSQAVAMLTSVLAGACGEVRNTPQADAGSGDGASALAVSCADLGAASANQNVQLHLDGDALKPYQAHCSADLKTYIPLGGTNTSSYPVGGCATLPANAAAGVVTSWQMVRFDPATHLVDTGDYAFATSTGVTHELSGNGSLVHDFANIPFGSGRSCVQVNAVAVAAIDLTGTHFAITSAQAWAADGFQATADAAVNPQRIKATISATGFPVGVSPCAANADYSTLTGGACLKLDYVP